MENDKKYTEELEKKAVLPVGTKTKLSTIFNYAEPINSEHNTWLKPESVRRVVLSVPRLIGRKMPHVGDVEMKLYLTNNVGHACQRVQNITVNKGRIKRQ